MGQRLVIWAILAVGLAGCRAPAPVCRSLPPSAPVPIPELPLTKPEPLTFDLSKLPNAPLQLAAASETIAYRKLLEPQCQSLAARNSSLANTLDDENRLTVSSDKCESESDRLKRTVRQLAALESRNQSAAGAFERYFQLADAEARAAIAREAGPILDDLYEKAAGSKKANLRYPLDPDDVNRQRGSLVTQIEQADATIAALNIDLRRRLALPVASSEERLWPAGNFDIDPEPANTDEAVAAALKDRPELRSLRALHAGLNVNTLPTARDLLRSAVPLLSGGSTTGDPTSGLGPITKCLLAVHLRRMKPDPCAAAEVEIRKKQLADLIASRERDTADETRVAVLALNAQTRRVAAARDRLDERRKELAEANRKWDARLIGSDLLLAQAKLEWLKARGDVLAEVMAWHQARVRLKAAMGWLADEGGPGR